MTTENFSRYLSRHQELKDFWDFCKGSKSFKFIGGFWYLFVFSTEQREADSTVLRSGMEYQVADLECSPEIKDHKV